MLKIIILALLILANAGLYKAQALTKNSLQKRFFFFSADEYLFKNERERRIQQQLERERLIHVIRKELKRIKQLILQKSIEKFG
jgi:hypothetical protein